jgi:hypothetical protein
MFRNQTPPNRNFSASRRVAPLKWSATCGSIRMYKSGLAWRQRREPSRRDGGPPAVDSEIAGGGGAILGRQAISLFGNSTPCGSDGARRVNRSPGPWAPPRRRPEDRGARPREFPDESLPPNGGIMSPKMRFATKPSRQIPRSWPPRWLPRRQAQTGRSCQPRSIGPQKFSQKATALPTRLRRTLASRTAA